jgi:hypothetical protein
MLRTDNNLQMYNIAHILYIFEPSFASLFHGNTALNNKFSIQSLVPDTVFAPIYCTFPRFISLVLQLVYLQNKLFKIQTVNWLVYESLGTECVSAIKGSDQ